MFRGLLGNSYDMRNNATWVKAAPVLYGAYLFRGDFIYKNSGLYPI